MNTNVHALLPCVEVLRVEVLHLIQLLSEGEFYFHAPTFSHMLLFSLKKIGGATK